ncbi:tax1-binding protein 1 homolog B isoform X2 [Brienomyrus brachyistius]|uniref:tax1-binding protein 1 homolog B isoform X2 n=1 Tax=Brienomyrus brachyistius TaxID=42636 RepID=UPI0020B22B2D|nr:tax1-binding protein 1 homolog B isoform X2 [Brienomyrus brachyistius]
MALFHEGTLANSGMETSNFAHVIFQNMGKSYLPHAALECSYTLSQYIKPHPKDWVGIFKVGWSSARDYHTFLWSPLPEKYVEGTTVSRTLVFQGYYVPGDDGEFYQFCYVTHKGEIRGASTPFQFRVGSPTDDLLTMEDDNSDILVVTTKAGFLEKKLEDLQKENEELSKEAADKQKEKEQILEERKELERACEREREACCQLKSENQELLGAMRTLQEEREEAKKRHAEEAARVAQLEQDLIGVTQKGLQKETELDCLRDRVKKLTQEKDTLETQLKNERDEKSLYKVHLKNRELENTKLTAELQVLKSVDVNKENTIVQLKEEVGRLEACVAEKEKLQREILAQASATRETDTLKEKLRQAEEQLQSTRQQAAMLASELRDASSARDRSASELYRARQELEELRTGQAEARAECSCLADELDRARGATRHRAGSREEMGSSVVMATEPELQREVEDLKLRLQMAGEHYKEKYKECQKLQRQVVKLSEQQGEMKKSPGASGASVVDVTASPPPKSLEPSTLGAATSVDVLLDTLIQEKLKDISKEVVEKSDKYKRCKQMLSEEKERSSVFADELTKMETKWKEQLKINENLKLQLAAEEDRYKSQVAEKGREVKELRESLAVLTKEKEKLEEELQKAQVELAQQAKSESLERTQPVLLHYPLPYPEDPPLTPLVPGLPADLQFGNPYSSPQIQDGSDAELSLEQIPRLPPAGPPSWDSDVVCIQPSRNPSRPDGLEDPEEQNNDSGQVQQEGGDEVQNSPLVEDSQTPFRFDSSSEIQKRCPLCEVIFPPNYEQSKFEEHVESHWKVCPMCGTQFPLDCDQGAFEEHVLTHFSGEALNFD